MKKLKIASAVAVSSAAALGVGINVLKRKNICPLCEIKKALSSLDVHVKDGEKFSNGVALTPPMGWSSWNTFASNINEDLIYETALAMKNSGLLEAGYNYVNIDDCWHSSLRDKDGRLQGDLTAFPSGIKNLVERINALGFKVGLYSSNGTLTCEDLPASLGNERIDAETLAEWGVEYFKYDFCHNESISSKAPLIEQIIITAKSGDFSKILTPENAVLSGSAKILSDDKGCFIGRLDANLGSAVFRVENVPADDEYIVTFIVRKNGEKEKFLTLTVNGKDEYELSAPPTKAWSKSGRVQLFVKLKKDENIIEIKNPIGSKMDSAARQYINMGKELKRATRLFAEKNGVKEKPIVYSICEWGLNKPWKWGSQAGNLWRTTPDIKPFWASVVGIYEINVKLGKYSGVGAYNDPDMLEVGNGKLTYDENISHFSLWCMMSAPLILGNDVRKFVLPDGTVDKNNRTLEIVTNKNLIAINQDKRCIQCERIRNDLLHDILIKPLENGELAVCFFNKGPKGSVMRTDINELRKNINVDLPESKKYECLDLWDNKDFETNGEISCEVPSHGVKVYRIKSC
ncbi:MAG: hypothetical protein E7515_00565 [Ruminococcaceae bacterium]|nr:hypothetical protein [Oscillospiraceae bacterium]